MSRGGKRPSIRDVAAAAGVSHQTVSRVLNSPELVRPETKTDVEKAISALGYRRSMVARSLATNHSMLIGVIAVQSSLVGPTELKFGIDQGALARGYSTVHITLQNATPDTLKAARNRLWDLGVDGVIVLAWSQATVQFAAQLATKLPTCVVAEGVVPAELSRVHGDQFGGAREATQAMLAAGCRTIGHLAGPVDWLEAEARRAGWRAGGGVGPCVEAGWDASQGYIALGELLDLDPSVDGIFAANDHVAIGAMKRLAELGKQVPGDVAIVGFDDIAIGTYLPVPLSSVRQPFAKIGETAVSQVFELLARSEARDCSIATELVVRESLPR